jgi:isopentenyl-diphosphate delta-isomerase
METRSQVVLVDENDRATGLEEKLSAHKRGALHRAISVFVFNSKGETMLQQRADSKYHSAGLWSNTCCSHPFKDETVLDSAHRRLREEMGFDCELQESFSFIYKVALDHGLTENEFDHVIFGRYDGNPSINRAEAKDWKWMPLSALKEDVKKNPGSYTSWLKILLDGLLVASADTFLKAKVSTSHGTS